MESTFVLILISAGLLVVILGAILVTSERELKVKRRQIEELLARLENVPDGGVATVSSSSDPSGDTAELQMRNRDLENQLRTLSDKLEANRGTIDELQAEIQGKGQTEYSHPAETERLRISNEQLQSELNQLRSRLAAGEAQSHHGEPRSPDPEEDDARMQIQMADLRQELEASQLKIRHLEAAQQHVPDVDALEADHRRQQEALQERIAELERQVAADRQMLAEAQPLRQRLSEVEEIQNALRDQIRRYDENIPRWQARIAEGEEHRRRLGALRAPFEELLSKQATLAEQQRQVHEDLITFSRLLTVPDETGGRPFGSPTNESESQAGRTTDFANGLEDARDGQTAAEASTPVPQSDKPLAPTHGNGDQ